MPSPSLTTISEPSAVQLESQLDGIDSSLTSLTTRVDTAETDITAAEGNVTTLQSDVLSLQNSLSVLNTAVLIQAALDANSGVTLTEKITFQASDLDDVISVTADKTLSFLNCSNVGFLIGWNDSLSTLRPTVSFESCVLNSTKTDFLDLFNVDSSVGELLVVIRNCVDSTGASLPDMSYFFFGGTD